MRPTVARFGDMPGPKVYNLWWGDKSGMKHKGTVSYAVSPFRQRANTGIIQGYLFNGFRRLATQVPYWIIPFVGGYLIYDWAKKKDAFNNSKAGHLAMHGEGGH